MRQKRRLRRIADIRKKNSRYRRGNYGKKQQPDAERIAGESVP